MSESGKEGRPTHRKNVLSPSVPSHTARGCYSPPQQGQQPRLTIGEVAVAIDKSRGDTCPKSTQRNMDQQLSAVFLRI